MLPSSVLSWFTSLTSSWMSFSVSWPVLKMPGVQILACFWTLLLTQNGFVHSDTQFLERHEGESVVLLCAVEQRNLPPYGLYVKRGWLQPSDVLFMHTESDFVVANDADQHRIRVSGDPSSHVLNVTISELRVSDTDRYDCEFYINNPSTEDERVRGNTDFFLLVTADAPGSLDIGLVETCAGGSAALPCLPPNGEDLAVEGVSLKRQRGRAPVEMLYHSKRHRGIGPSSSSSSSSTQFPTERVQLSSAPGPGGITYNLTLQQLQPEESGLYSCQLLVHGRSETISSLGRRVFFVSVQASHCSCSIYSTLLYAVSSAAALLLLSLLIGFVVIYKDKATRHVKSHPQAPVYEEMLGVQPLRRKAAPHQLDDMESSEYRNCPVKKSCPENHYESPSGALCSRT